MKKICITYSNKTIKVEGLFLYVNLVNESAISTFLEDYINDVHDFNAVMGSFLAEIDDNGEKVYFADNSGMRRWYYHNDNLDFCNSLKAALPSEVNPNYSAISEYLQFGNVFSTFDTVIDRIKVSDPEKYYVIKDGKNKVCSKGLKSFDQIKTTDHEVEKVMGLLCDAFHEWKNRYAVITGGIDSRAVLAHILYQGIKPNLTITGSPNHIDVLIAKEIADLTGLQLAYIPDDINEEKWIDEAIEASKIGGTVVCGTWRLYKKARFLSREGDVIECGGFAGEMYKNSFINQDYPFYFGKINWKKFLKYKVMTGRFPIDICGEKIINEVKKTEQVLIKWLQQYEVSANKNKSYFNAGYRVLQMRGSGVLTMNSFYYDAYSPLLERNVVASVYNRNPYSLEMQSWQREQVSSYCPELKGVRTDRKLTADNRKKTAEWIKSMAFLTRIYLERLLFRKISDKPRIDTCFEKGLCSKQFYDAFDRCKELGIIKKEILPEQLPVNVADRLFFLGSIFI